MITMTLILNRVLPSTPVYHLTVDFIPVFIVAVLFGPIWSAATYAIADTIGAILFPVGPYNPGITLTLLVIGLIFGLVFYKKDLTGISLWIRSFVASAGALLVKLFATTYFLFLIYGAFARRYLGNRFFFLFLRLLRCFSSAGLPPPYYFIHMAVIGHEPNCVSTFGNLRVKRIFAPNRSLSQLITSFIGT